MQTGQLNTVYRDQLFPSQLGTLWGTDPGGMVESLVNDDPSTAQVTTVTVGTVTHSATYTISIDDTTITYTADSATTDAEIVAGLVAAVNAESLVNARVLAAATAATTFTLTGRYPGIGFTFSESDAKLSSAATTANATASEVGFGLGVMYDTANDKYAKLVAAAGLTARVVTLTPTAVNSQRYTATFEINGLLYPAYYDADGSATAQEIVEGLTAAINTVAPTETVLASEDNAILTLTAELGGKDFVLTESNGLAVTSDNLDELTDINSCFAGVAVATHIYSQDGTTAVYPAKTVMAVTRDKPIVVSVETEVTRFLPVYMRISGTGTAGAFSTAAGAGLVLMKGYRWMKNLGNSMAVLARV